MGKHHDEDGDGLADQGKFDAEQPAAMPRAHAHPEIDLGEDDGGLDEHGQPYEAPPSGAANAIADHYLAGQESP